MERLTADAFGAMMEKHPDFELHERCWTWDGGGECDPCGGCAMTLAFFDTFGTPQLHAGEILPSAVRAWSNAKYGEEYCSGFVNGFDAQVVWGIGQSTNRRIGVSDGQACRQRAKAAGRLHLNRVRATV